MKSLLVHMNLKVGFAAGIILVVVTTLTIVSLRVEDCTYRRPNSHSSRISGSD
jgi:hypothetical protein